MLIYINILDNSYTEVHKGLLVENDYNNQCNWWKLQNHNIK